MDDLDVVRKGLKKQSTREGEPRRRLQRPPDDAHRGKEKNFPDIYRAAGAGRASNRSEQSRWHRKHLERDSPARQIIEQSPSMDGQRTRFLKSIWRCHWRTFIDTTFADLASSRPLGYRLHTTTDIHWSRKTRDSVSFIVPLRLSPRSVAFPSGCAAQPRTLSLSPSLSSFWQNQLRGTRGSSVTGPTYRPN